jgi:hypothetical protein
MTNICLNHKRTTYDFCRDCKGYEIDCPEYLSDIEHTRKSPRVEKLVEIPDYETANGVVRYADAKADNSSNIRTHSESYSKPVVLLQNIRSKIEPMIARPDFLERFYRSQR